MCGIAGIVSFRNGPIPVEELHAMCGTIDHRGPDDYGYLLRPGAALGMRRLSIIDLDGGRQPVKNEDGTIWVVFNGEIYNYRELRRWLVSRGHILASDSDTEVIVHLYEEHGPRFVEKLRGMFAIAVWDERTHRLLLARDRFGIKPLYYMVHDGRLLFGSELKTILQARGVPRDLSWSSLGHLLTYMVTPETESILSGIRKLQPAHVLIASAENGLEIQKYWDLTFEPDVNAREEEVIERLRGLLEESVRLHMVSDVSVGAFLSGGIDSSTVVSMMSALSAGPIKTFSIGFPEDDYSELHYARMIARRFGTDHHELILEPDVLSLIDDLAWYLDEPFGDSSAIPTYMVSKLAAGHVKVVLSGDGGDEVFAGYDRYLKESRERKWRFVPAAARGAIGLAASLIPDGVRGRNFLRHVSLPEPFRYLDRATLFRHEELRRLLHPEAFAMMAHDEAWNARASLLRVPGQHWLSTLQQLDIRTYLPLDILTKVDRMSMAHSLEARVPLLDHVLVEFAATIPPDMRLRNGRTKHVLKQAMNGLLPDEILDRPKRGFAVPLGRWFRGQLGTVLRDLLLSTRCRERGILNIDHVARLLDRHDRGRELDLHLWTLLSFELWCRRFLDEPMGLAQAEGAMAVGA